MKYFIINRNNHAINFEMVMKVLGQLLMIEAGFMALPLIVSLISHENDSIFCYCLSTDSFDGTIIKYLFPSSKQDTETT